MGVFSDMQVPIKVLINSVVVPFNEKALFNVPPQKKIESLLILALVLMGFQVPVNDNSQH